RSGSERVGLGWPASGDANRTATSITPPIKLCYALVTLGKTGAPGFGRAHIEDDWGRGMNYSRRWGPDFGEFMSFERLLRLPTQHFRRHRVGAHAVARDAAGGVAGVVEILAG